MSPDELQTFFELVQTLLLLAAVGLLANISSRGR